VFFLYRSAADAREGVAFGGTGFIVAMPTKRWPTERLHTYAVTNWHLAVRDGFSVVRLNTLTGATDTIEYGPEDWVFRPNWHDIAIVPLASNTSHKIKSLDQTFIMPSEREPELDFGVGDDVFMLGRFVDYDGHQTNKPAARFGHISMTDAAIRQPTGYRGGSVVVDLHSRTGFSGSPVFVYRTPGSYFPDPPEGELQVMRAHHVMRLLGIHWGQFPERWELRESEGGQDIPSHASLVTEGRYVEGMSGMTCVCPGSAIRQLLDDHQMEQRRESAELALEEQLRQTE
jgi:hypothetical protein